MVVPSSWLVLGGCGGRGEPSWLDFGGRGGKAVPSWLVLGGRGGKVALSWFDFGWCDGRGIDLGGRGGATALAWWIPPFSGSMGDGRDFSSSNKYFGGTGGGGSSNTHGLRGSDLMSTRIGRVPIGSGAATSGGNE